jgi:hypothetical protein
MIALLSSVIVNIPFPAIRGVASSSTRQMAGDGSHLFTVSAESQYPSEDGEAARWQDR